MTRLTQLLRRFARHQGGATAIEYGLLLALLSVVVIGAVTSTGVKLFTLVNNASNAVGR